MGGRSAIQTAVYSFALSLALRWAFEWWSSMARLLCRSALGRKRNERRRKRRIIGVWDGLERYAGSLGGVRKSQGWNKERKEGKSDREWEGGLNEKEGCTHQVVL